jgi:hypothetical protein
LFRKGNCRSLHFATPDFLLTLVALVHFMRPSLRKGAHAALSSAAWQEIRVRFGRDDKVEGGAFSRHWLLGSTEQQVPPLRFAPVGMTPLLRGWERAGPSTSTESLRDGGRGIGAGASRGSLDLSCWPHPTWLLARASGSNRPLLDSDVVASHCGRR